MLDFPATSFEEVLNIDFDAILAKLERFPGSYFDLFPDYNVWLFDRAYWISFYLMMLSPILIAFPYIVKQMMLSPKDRPTGYVSRPARVFLWVLHRVIHPCKDFITSYIDFMQSHKVITGFLQGFNKTHGAGTCDDLGFDPAFILGKDFVFHINGFRQRAKFMITVIAEDVVDHVKGPHDKILLDK